MATHRFRRPLGLFLAILTLSAGPILADSSHGIALYGEPALPQGFSHLPYVNPDAPKGGRFVDGQVGGFDSLNPHIQKGRVPWQLRYLASESLMGQSWDEPFTLYGVLAERVKADPAGAWVEYHLNPAARFSDGTPVTVDDVMWSYEVLGTQGHGRYRGGWSQIAGMEAVGARGVRFTFTQPDRELALLMGMRPILKKAQWEGTDFAESGLETAPISSAPYVITAFEANRFVELTRNPDYWGADLPYRRGTNNIDTIRMEFFGDATAMFEAFKAGALSTMRETNAAKWAEQYDFPRVRSGDVVKSDVAHQRPTGMTGLVMNTRRPLFADWRVREAMIQAFNFEYMNNVLNGGTQPRITSYFANSPLGMQAGAATGRVAELLATQAAHLLPDTVEGYVLPVSDGQAANRSGIRAATRLLEEAGYTVQDGVLRGPQGAVTFNILLPIGSPEVSSVVDIYLEALKRLGITATVTAVDSAQFNERTNTYDFDMTYNRWGLSLSPGNEQLLYWGPEGVTVPGSRNWMGADNPAIPAMVQAMLTAKTTDDYIAGVRALDRVLTAGRYVIPVWHNPVSWIAHDATLKYPADRVAIYGDWIGFQPDVWWREE